MCDSPTSPYAPTTNSPDALILPNTSLKVGLFGGTFNPVHNGHLAIATQALEQFNLDAVIWIPAGLPPHKPLASGASNRNRLEMVKLAIANHPQFLWSTLELNRPGPSFAIDTISQFKADSPHVQKWYWIIGADAIADLPSWHRAAEVAGYCHWIVAPRPETSSDRLLETLHEKLPRLQASWLAGGAELDISSSSVRKRLKSGQAVTSLLPHPVNQYLRARKLYTQ